jgi:hypothetical protein
VSEVDVAVEFELALLGRGLPERMTCDELELSDELVALPTISPVLTPNIVVVPIVVVIVFDPLVIVETIGAVVMGEDSVIVDE